MNKVINQSKLFQFIADGGQGQTVPCCMLLILLEVINYVFIYKQEGEIYILRDPLSYSHQFLCFKAKSELKFR